ncbi:MAG: ABC transporter ATP-binding protein [Candidatus Thermoplasmatota archaeon]|nr:ABC transporter ATP-binding protein [Candidatus Thermoplasmatota archaeon]
MNAVEIQGLHRSFGRIKAVDGLDLSVRSGQVFGLLGPNGSGKTTTIKILCGLLKQDRGSFKVLGSSDRKYLKKIGYMPQETALYEDLTVHENMKLFGGFFGLRGEFLEEREKEMLEMVGLYERRDFTLSSLSGGQRHRISLAVSMIHKPELLFLDEPTVGVDPPLRSRFWKSFEKIKEEGRTIIMSTHYMDEASNCDGIGMMRDGKLISEGTTEEIMDSTGSGSLEEAFLTLTRGEP